MTPADRAARERKQKIFVAVGGLVLVALLAFQLPRLLGGSSSSNDASDTTSTVAAGDGGSVTTHVAATRSLAVLQGQLTSFEHFGAKDPFVQQVKLGGASAPSGASSAHAPASAPKKPAKPATQGFSVGAQPTASMTVISVNGARQALSAGTRFPAADPVFVLVAEQPKSQSVTIGIAGGAYVSGSRTTKLVLGKPLVLVNTTTGARYKLVVVAVGNGKAATTPTPENGPPTAGGGSAPSATPQSTTP
jgi:hypothetical protein